MGDPKPKVLLQATLRKNDETWIVPCRRRRLVQAPLLSRYQDEALTCVGNKASEKKTWRTYSERA